MKRRHCLVCLSFLACALPANGSVSAQGSEPVQLIIEAGRPLRLALDRQITVKRVGQQITATLVEPVFAFDRIVVPAGTKVLGHIAQLEDVARSARVRAMLAGDFTPLHHVRLQFDTLVMSAARTLPIQTAASVGTESVSRQVARDPGSTGVTARAKSAVGQKAKRTIAIVTGPGKAERVKNMLILALPYHPEFLRKGTVYNARLISPVDFGPIEPTEWAPAGTLPAPDSILNARLVSAVDSVATAVGAPIEAVITAPVFSADHRLILPEGATLTGHVTFSKRARRFHRNGQLRFLFDTVKTGDRTPAALVASLYSADSGEARLTVDEEGGAGVTNTKSRLIAPTLGALAVVGMLHGRVETDTDGAGPETQYGGAGSSAVGGYLGASLIGVALTQLSRPVTLTVGITGLARSAYSNVFGKGRDISFPADTAIQVRLAPGPGSGKR